MHRKHLLFLTILIEGYVVLASELLAIRQLVPFVGSGTETVAIIISAVLLPLAIGYHRGGTRRRLIRKQLVRNVLIALCFLTFGLSYIALELFFTGLNSLGIRQPILQAFCYAACFLVYPIYLLGQTVPLVSNYFPQHRISELTGRMLFFSTVGSFFGSVFSTLVLMNTVGVHATVIVTLALLTLLVFLLSRRVLCDSTMLAALALLLVIASNSPASLRALNIVSNNAYNMVVVREDPRDGARYMQINRSSSSALSRDGKPIYPYITYLESVFIAPISKPGNTPRDMLILGAGGFSIGLEDHVNRYSFVDIDPALKTVAEAHFLRAPLSTNKRFIAQSARAFIRREEKQYDFILIDTFTNVLSAPMESTTREFLMDAKKLLKPDGILVVNQIGYPDMRDRFSARYDRTFASVFPHYNRQVIGAYNPWEPHIKSGMLHNIIYSYYRRSDLPDTEPYTDDLTTYSLDHDKN